MSENLDIEWRIDDPNESDSARANTPQRLRAVISDAFAFIRSMEANQAFATVTLEQLINDQIARNGDSDRSNAAQYDPYSYSAEKLEPASVEPAERANFLGASDTSRPTKLDRVLALVNSISDIVDQIKSKTPVDVATPEDYTDSAEESFQEYPEQ
jgi:hypothetical protein